MSEHLRWGVNIQSSSFATTLVSVLPRECRVAYVVAGRKADDKDKAS